MDLWSLKLYMKHKPKPMKEIKIANHNCPIRLERKGVENKEEQEDSTVHPQWNKGISLEVMCVKMKNWLRPHLL